MPIAVFNDGELSKSNMSSRVLDAASRAVKEAREKRFSMRARNDVCEPVRCET